MDVPEHQGVPLPAQDVVDTDIGRLEPAVGLLDVVGVGLSSAPNETVTRLSTSCTMNAPPVAEFATKSAVSATGRGLSAAF